MKSIRPSLVLSAVAVAAALLVTAPPAQAHCDSVEGPVVVDAKAALGKGDVAPVLKWISAAQEPAVRDAFQKTLVVRKLGPEAQQLADTAFFETLVRLHRETEGFPYTGLKKGGNEPAFIGQLESALAAGSVDDFARLVGEHSAAGIKAKFARALEAKKKADGTRRGRSRLRGRLRRPDALHEGDRRGGPRLGRDARRSARGRPEGHWSHLRLIARPGRPRAGGGPSSPVDQRHCARDRD